jgi:hypothetical protein
MYATEIFVIALSMCASCILGIVFHSLLKLVLG